MVDFTVTPAGASLGQGLSGLGEIIAANRAAKEEKAKLQEVEKRKRDMMGAVYDAYTSKNTDKWAEVVNTYPEAAEMAMRGVGANEQWQRDEMGDFALRVLQSPETAIQEADKRIALGTGQGRNMSDTQELRDLIASGDVEGAKHLAEIALLTSSPEKFKQYRELTKEKEATPYTDIGKAKQDLAANLITQDQFDAIAQKETTSPVGTPPATLQELEALKKMSPEDQKTFWQLKGKMFADTGVSNDLTGEEYLMTLPPQFANTVKAIAEGRQTLSSSGTRGPDRVMLQAALNQYDPSYDEAEAKSRYKAMTDFATGKNGNTVRSLNVSIDHLGTLQKAADALKNGNMQAFNAAGNFFASQSGNPAPTDFNATKKIVADEIVKGIVGSGGGVADREEAAKSISGVNSPAQLYSVIERYKDLLGGQLHGLKKQYEATTSRKDFDERFLTPEAQQQLGNREGGDESALPQAAIDEGVSAQEWQLMTPEQKALFQ